MKTNELKELGADELAAKIREARAELADLKLKHASKAEVESRCACAACAARLRGC